jgi:phosphoserine phosphatase
VAGTLDIHDMHRASVGPLAKHDLSRIDGWAAEFGQAMSPRLPQAMKSLVQSHLVAGHLCALVTATTRFVAEPLGWLFGLRYIVATDPVIEGVGDARHLTGEIAGDPCYREHKVSRVAAWLAELPKGAGRGGQISRFERSWFYSDSASDLPLLQTVTDPVAVAPDARLRVLALESGWPIIEAMH